MANPHGNPQNLIPFRPGQSGNPGGKPVQARNRLTNAFLNALADDFDQHGAEAIEACRLKSPAQYVAILASLLPKDHRQEHPGPLSELSDDELAASIDLLRALMQHGEQIEQGGEVSNQTLQAVGAVNGAEDD